MTVKNILIEVEIDIIAVMKLFRNRFIPEIFKPLKIN